MLKIQSLTWEHWCARLCLSVLLGMPFSGYASTTSCNIGIPGGIKFTYSIAGATSNGTIAGITCNYTDSPDPVYIYLTNPGSVNPRQMTSGGNTLSYNLYTDAAYTLIWGDGLNGTNVRGPFDCIGASPCTVNLPSPNNLIYGKIPAGSLAMAGSYQQMVIAMISASPSGGASLGSFQFPVSTDVPTSCSISASNVSLNYFSNSPTAVNGNSVLQIQCNAIGSYSVTLQSANSGAMNGSGILKDTDNHALAYQLYQPINNQPNAACAYTTAWGVSPDFSLWVPDTSAHNYNACLSIPAMQNAAAGTYTDTVNVTINF